VPSADRGYQKLFYDTVTQADKGVDFDFLRATTTRGVIPRS
jgi:dihydroxy-acid dehydratase